MHNLSYYPITKHEKNYNAFERQTTYIKPSNTDENLLLHPMKAMWLYLNTPLIKAAMKDFSTTNLLRSITEANTGLQCISHLPGRKIV